MRVGAKVLGNDHVVALGKVVEDLLADLWLRLDTDQGGLKTLHVKTREDLWLMQFDVDREKVNVREVVRAKKIIQPDRRYADSCAFEPNLAVKFGSADATSSLSFRT